MRLTKYEPSENSMFPYKLKDEELSTELDGIHKLGQLEDIEDKIGIELLALLNNRPLSQIIGYVWYKTKHPKTNKEIIIKRDVWSVQDNGVIVVRSYDEEYVTGLNIKDYGVTWALTQKELL